MPKVSKNISILALFVAFETTGGLGAKASAACPSISNDVLAKIAADPELLKFHFEQKSCRTLQHLAAAFSNSKPSGAPSKHSAKANALSAASLKGSTGGETTMSGVGSSPSPAHGTADYAQLYAQRFFVRQNALDAFYYLYPAVPDSPSDATQVGSASNAQGASLSWTDDRLNRDEIINIQAYTGYVLARALNLRAPTDSSSSPYLSKWALAPWLYANGTLNEPSKSSDKNAIQIGAEVQAEISRLGPLSIVDFRGAPYFQTDFRAEARIEGFDGLAEPYDLDIFLGGADHAILNDFVFFYWRLLPEVDIRHVGSAGMTNLQANAMYEWLGGSIQAKAFLFHNSPSQALADRIYITATTQWYGNVGNTPGLYDYLAQVGYNLDAGGNSSISFQYSYGTDKSTLLKASQYKVQLNYKM